MNDIIKEYIESIKTDIQRTEAERLLRSLFKEGLDIDVLRKTFSQFLSHEELEIIIADEVSKMNEKPLCTREEALQIALRKINQGCCVQYVSDGLKEWLGIEINPAELDTELSDHPGLLPSYQRLRNAWHNIRYVEPESITPLQIQEKYGFDWKYQEYVLGSCEDDEQDSTPAAEPAPKDEVQTLSKQIIDKNRGVYESLASTDKERPE
ncbi:hypothetical protein NE634_15470 [Lacrimispora saccharolytica]|nr:hypothetical protein [Lacrimispora saccharolytica]